MDYIFLDKIRIEDGFLYLTREIIRMGMDIAKEHYGYDARAVVISNVDIKDACVVYTFDVYGRQR